MNLLSAHLESSFCCLPARKISNFTLFNDILTQEKSVLKTEMEILSSIKKYTGIEERRYSYENEAASDLAIKAIKPLFLSNPLLKEGIKAILIATTSGDYPSPATANWVHRGLQLNTNVQCLDVSSSCSSFLSAFRAAFGFLSSHSGALVAASEVKHKGLSKSDIRTLSLFADGSGGVYLKNNSKPNSQFLFAHQEVNTELANNISIPVGGSREFYSEDNKNNVHLQFLEPKKMFVHTVKSIVSAILNLYNTYLNNPQYEKLNFIFIHQANRNILEEVRSRLPNHLSSKIPSLMADVGNMVSASLPVLRVRVLFLQTLICFHKRPFKKDELVSVFLNACSKNAKFKYYCHCGGIIFESLFSEKLFIFDDGCLSLEESWLTRISEDEFYFILENAYRDNFLDTNFGVDFWVSAGGGFQTLGIIHSRF